jgi:uncharacterized protein DUF6662
MELKSRACKFAGLTIWCALSIGAYAGVRPFTYVYEATTSAPGSIESENSVTWKTSMRNDRRFNELDIRNEIEVGITDRFQASIYFANWNDIESPGNNEHGWHYDSAALELVYNLFDPNKHWLGAAVYEEIRGGSEIFEVESKFILQKNVGRWTAAYNLGLEAEWEGEEWGEKNGEFSQSLGVSYEIVPALSAGVELLHEIDLPEWSRANRSIVYAGPNISYRHGRWWMTLTQLFQATNAGSEVDFQTRAIVGYSF